MVSFTLRAALLASFALSGFAHPQLNIDVPDLVNTLGCGAIPPTEFLKSVASMATSELKLKNLLGRAVTTTSKATTASSTPKPNAIVIDTYFHVVAKDNTAAGGFIPAQQLRDQLAVMNKDYAPQSISFNLIATDYTVNPTWASNGDELGMKRALRKGNYKTLNLYFLYDMGGFFGYCYYPIGGLAPGSDGYVKDGCSIMFKSVPGGAAKGYNLGKTAVHEIGHWFGLLHTFQGGCDGSGDEIADTPAQASATQGCPKTRDSCPGQPGVDPINNYMDYSSDACYTGFTAGQMTRVQNMFQQFRARG